MYAKWVRRDVSFAPRSTTVSPLVGGFAGLLYPAVLVVAAVSVGYRTGGGMGDFAASIAAAVLFIIATPTAWVLAFSFIEVSRLAVLAFGVVTSFPLWWILGRAVAGRSQRWGTWFRTYAVACVAWTASNFVLFGVFAAIFS